MAQRERKRPGIAGLFDEQTERARRDRPGGDAARLEALAALSMGDDGDAAELDAARAAAYLDDAMSADDRAAFELALARSADLREQLAGFAATRAAAAEAGAAMPAEYEAAFDAVPAPPRAAPAAAPSPAAATAKPGWLAGLLPSRRWAYATVPVLLVAVVLAVIGPDLYREARGPAPREPAVAGAVGGATMAARPPQETKERLAEEARRAEAQRQIEAQRQTEKARRRAETEGRQAQSQPQTGGAGAGRSFVRRDAERPAPSAPEMAKRREFRAAEPKPETSAGATPGPKAKSRAPEPPAKVAEKDAKRAPAQPAKPATPGSGPALAETVVPVSAELRAALLALAAQKDKTAARARSSGAVGGLTTGAKGEAERKAAEAPAALADTQGRYMAVLDRALGGGCPGGGACCRPRTIDPALVKALRAGGAGPAEIQVTYYAGGACRLGLPPAAPAR